MKKLIGVLGITILLAVFCAGFAAYLVSSYDPATGITRDGLGRTLYDSPWFMRLIFGQDRLWPGWAWFFGDLAIFWSGVLLGVAMVQYGLIVPERA